MKVNVEIEDFLQVKDAATKAISNFNKEAPEFKLVDEANNYKIKLSKKSGMPDIDLPGLYTS